MTRSPARVLFAFLLTFGPACTQHREASFASAPESSRPKPAAQKWTCSMHPSYVSDREGECPICHMDLTLVRQPDPAPSTGATSATGTTGTTTPGSAAVTIGEDSRRLLGLKTVAVERRALAATVRTTGRIAFDETLTAKLQPRFDGYVEKLYADFTGKPVRKGEPMVAVYSPELYATQQEFLLATKAQASLSQTGLPAVADAARARLLNYGVSAAQLDAIARSGQPARALDLVAPRSGFVTSKSVVAGSRVSANEPLFEIADLSRVWVLADVYEHELPRVRVGQAATLTLTYWAGRKWKGRVSYIYPTVDDKTRTVKVRIEIDNPKTELKPEMFADVLLAMAPRDALVIPDHAIIESGTRKIVFVARGEGRFEPRPVVTGDHAEGLYEILEGLALGDEVAVGANFLVDSESRLRAALSHVDDAPASPAAQAPASHAPATPSPTAPSSPHGGH